MTIKRHGETQRDNEGHRETTERHGSTQGNNEETQNGNEGHRMNNIFGGIDI